MNTTRLTAAMLSLALLGSLAACAGSSASAASGTVSVSTSAPAQETPGPNHNDADTSFAQHMTIHHEGALEMAGLATTNAASQEIKDLALLITAAQAPEIETMTWWLDTWGEDSAERVVTETAGALDHSGMLMGGLTHEEAMLELTGLAGAEFDSRFLELMLAHHEGGLVMAQEEIAGGVNDEAIALAQSIVTAQTADMALMRDLLTTV